MTMGMMVYATHKNWHDLVLNTLARDHHSGYQEQLKNAYAKQDELNHNIEKLQNILSLEKASHLQELAKAETAKAKAEEHKAELEQAVKLEQERLDTDAKALEIAQKNLTDSAPPTSLWPRTTAMRTRRPTSSSRSRPKPKTSCISRWGNWPISSSATCNYPMKMRWPA